MKISILTPSYNSGAYIERAIKSVLHQNYQNYEHIVVDGDSNDETRSILQKYDHLIWVSEPDKGQPDAMNKAFDMSTGDIIVYLNADDYFNSNVFQTVVDYFYKQPKLDILVGNLYLTYPESTKIRFVNSEYRFKKILLDFKYGFPYNPVCYFYKRQVQESLGDFPLDNHYAMDYWFILNTFKNNKVLKTDLVLGNYFDSGFNKSSISSGNTIRPVVKEFLKKNKVYRRYYNFNFFQYKVVYFFKVELKNRFKLVLLKLKNPSKKHTLNSIKRVTFRELLSSNKKD